MDYRWFLEGSQLEPFVYVDNFLSPEECNYIISLGKNEEYATKDTATVGGGIGTNPEVHEENSLYRKSNISWLRTDKKECQWVFERITGAIIDSNKQFFNFDIDHIENVQFTEYDSSYQGFYGKHIDIAYKSSRMRKLSFTIQLADETDYDGGDLCLFYSTDSLVMSRKQGTMTIFPSFAVHEVEPVKRGTRYSLVGWVVGPPFR